MQKVQALCWGWSLHCAICPLFCTFAITLGTESFPVHWLFERTWGKIHLRWKIWTQEITHSVTFPAFRDCLCQNSIPDFQNPSWASCLLYSTICIHYHYIYIVIILKCSKVLDYTTQLRLHSCWFSCIFFIVLFVFDSTPIYDYSKKHKLYHRKATVIPGNWENELKLLWCNSDNEPTFWVKQVLLIMLL